MEDLEKIIDKALQMGIRQGLEIALEEIRRTKQETLRLRHDRRLRNVRLLLENYRELMAHCRGVTTRSRQSAIEILDEIEDADTENYYVESVKRSKERTKIIMQHVNEMLDFYKDQCLFHRKPEYRRRYPAIAWMYLQDQEKTIDDIAADLFVSRAQVYDDLKEARKSLCALIFGIDGLNR